jgi:hypothetical protein
MRRCLKKVSTMINKPLIDIYMYVYIMFVCVSFFFFTEDPDERIQEEVEYFGSCYTVKSSDSAEARLKVYSLTQFYIHLSKTTQYFNQ